MFAQIAQLVEQGTENPRVLGSIPSLGTTRKNAVVSATAFFFLCAGHGIVLTGESPVTGIYRQV